MPTKICVQTAPLVASARNLVLQSLRAVSLVLVDSGAAPKEPVRAPPASRVQRERWARTRAPRVLTIVQPVCLEGGVIRLVWAGLTTAPSVLSGPTATSPVPQSPPPAFHARPAAISPLRQQPSWHCAFPVLWGTSRTSRGSPAASVAQKAPLVMGFPTPLAMHARRALGQVTKDPFEAINAAAASRHPAPQQSQQQSPLQSPHGPSHRLSPRE